jgi:hypothetical protein
LSIVAGCGKGGPGASLREARALRPAGTGRKTAVQGMQNRKAQMGIDPRRYGPGRGELWFRLAFSLAGLVLLAVAVVVRGFPTGPAMVEVGGIAGLFLGGTVVWAARRLILRLHP